MTEYRYDGEIDLDFLRACLLDAGRLALAQRGRVTAEMKPDHTPVTQADRQVEDFLIERITSRYPGHLILSEETGTHPGAEAAYSWIIDPIDGTRSYASGLPIWGISIGILRAGEPYAGGFYLPVTAEMYWGTTRQAYYNDQPIQSPQPVDPDSLLVFLAVPSNFHRHFTITYPRIRSLGSTAAHLAYVITGAAVGALTRNVGLWDLAGMLPLLAAAGIQVAALRGQPFHAADMLDGRTIREPLLVAHPSLMDRLRDSILQ